ncbi:MAG TPA: hypothetical protein VHD32_02940 [Candidatus Didemnitutus sp.]|nr:hypothetical protein [Candidatus Didemnitutus sp.]
MSLSDEQKKAVSSWVAAGESLSTIQKKLSDQFKISMTYMDVRFLVDDLGLELKNAAPKADASDVTKAKSAPAAAAGRASEAAPKAEKKGLMDRLKKSVGLDEEEEEVMPAEEAFEEEPDAGVPPVGGSVKVEVDRVIRPGAVVSGSVTFSDGVSAKWALDQMGRLMLDGTQKGYQPSAADVQAFQRELSRQLQQHGF